MGSPRSRRRAHEQSLQWVMQTQTHGKLAKQAKEPRKITKLSLERAALWRLERRALTVAQLRRSLLEKVRRAAVVHGPCAESSAWIDDVIERCLSSGLLDDKRVAAGRASALRDRGMSRRMILQRLRLKGVDETVAADALCRVDEDCVANHAAKASAADDAAADGDAELTAARQYVSRRRLHNKDRNKALASLARNGFSFDVAKRALAAVSAADSQATAT